MDNHQDSLDAISDEDMALFTQNLLLRQRVADVQNRVADLELKLKKLREWRAKRASL